MARPVKDEEPATMDIAGYSPSGVGQYTREAGRAGGSPYETTIARAQQTARILIPKIKAQLDRMEQRAANGDAAFRKRAAPAIAEKRRFLQRLAIEMQNGLDVS
jgi:hypothetical protein